MGRGRTASREPSATADGSSVRSRANSAPSAPNTARRMAFSVMRIIDGSVANAWSCGQEAISRTASSSMISSYAVKPAAVEGRDQQLALLAVLRSGQREERAGPEHAPEVGLDVLHDVGPRGEQLPDLRGGADDRGPAEDRHVDGERVAVPVAHAPHPAHGCEKGEEALQEPGARRARRERRGRHVRWHLPLGVRDGTSRTVRRRTIWFKAPCPYDRVQGLVRGERYSVSPMTTVRRLQDETATADDDVGRFRHAAARRPRHVHQGTGLPQHHDRRHRPPRPHLPADVL